MGTLNDLIYIKKAIGNFNGPYLEIGSKNYGNTQDIKALFSRDEKWVGVDREDGDGVDAVLDLSDSLETIDRLLGGSRFGTIFCLSVLEHCTDPFTVARNLMSLLKPGGKLCVSVPFACGFHGYPSDYWRFTHEGIKQLFPKLRFNMDDACVATTRANDFHRITLDIGRLSFSSKHHFEKGCYARGLSAKMVKLLSRARILHWLAGYKYVMPPSFIYMIGELPAQV